MPSQHGCLRYLFLKAFATFARLVVLIIAGRQRPSPDEVLQIPSRDPSRTIKLHIYHPHSKKQPQPTPILLTAHGSGFIIRLHGQDDLYCRRIANTAGVTVLDMSYRLAPEDPYPAAVNDLEDIIRWVLSHPEIYDLSRFHLGGFSAGGHLALANSLKFPEDTFKSLVLFYPPTNLASDPAKRTVPQKGGNPFPAWVANAFNRCFIPLGYDKRDPSISPIYGDPAKFPKSVLLITCGYDNLAPEAEELVQKIGKVPGRTIVTERVDREDHAWDKIVKGGTKGAEKRDRVYDLAARFIKG